MQSEWGNPEGSSQGVQIDLEQLERHARTLYLHRFVDAVRAVRSEHGRYLRLRAADETAIREAADDSGSLLDQILVRDAPIPGDDWDGTERRSPDG